MTYSAHYSILYLEVRERPLLKRRNKMFTKSQVIEAGGKLWEKGNIHRVYIKSNVVKKLIDFEKQCEDSYFEKNTKSIFKRMDSNQTWFNVETGLFESKKTTVDNFFNNGVYRDLFL